MATFRAGIEIVHCCNFNIGFEQGRFRFEVRGGFASTTLEDNLLSVGCQATNGYGLELIFPEHFESHFDSLEVHPTRTYQRCGWGKGWGIW
jgi:hypothetical protein